MGNCRAFPLNLWLGCDALEISSLKGFRGFKSWGTAEPEEVPRVCKVRLRTAWAGFWGNSFALCSGAAPAGRYACQDLSFEMTIQSAKHGGAVWEVSLECGGKRGGVCTSHPHRDWRTGSVLKMRFSEAQSLLSGELTNYAYIWPICWWRQENVSLICKKAFISHSS